MPTYLYYCNTCKKHVEYFEESPKNKKDDNQMFCASCKKLLKRVYNTTPVFYKGKGFYTTDNENNNKSET